MSRFVTNPVRKRLKGKDEPTSVCIGVSKRAFPPDVSPTESISLPDCGLQQLDSVASIGILERADKSECDLADQKINFKQRAMNAKRVDLNRLPPLAIRNQMIDQLRPYTGNARTHSRRQIKQIACSIEKFGFLNPIIVDRTNRILAGHGRVAAAKLLGLPQVPTICIEDLSEDQIRAYVIADNQIAANAGWDIGILKVELQHLTISDCLDLRVTGFEFPEIDLILGDAKGGKAPEEVLPVGDANTAVSRLGDHWLLREHHILCGDALFAECLKQLMDGHQADVAFNDVPYNVPIKGHATGNGKIKHREFAMAAGEQSAIEFEVFLTKCLGNIASHSKSGSVHFVCMDFRHMAELMSAGAAVFDKLLNLCVWCKNNGGMGSLYRSQHELVFVYKHGKAAHRNNVQLGKWNRNRTNVWTYPNVSTQSKQGDEGNLLAMHPTVKPIAMVADALLDVSARGDRVIDGFLGSGTTLMAAERVGRICHGLEIDPIYVDTAIRRWQRHTGESAINAESGRSFDDIDRELHRGERG